VNTGSITGQQDRGFTLLELLVVCVAGALLATLVPPLYSGAVAGIRLKATTHELASALRETRSLAILHNREEVLYLDPRNSRYRIGRNPPRALANGIRIDAGMNPAKHQMTVYRVRFFPDGSSSGALFRLSAEDRAYLLGMNWLLGDITVSEVSNDGPRP